MDELLAAFVVEARELIQQAAEDLLALERDPRDRQRLDSAFRAIHTLKGSVGLFPLAPLQETLHAAEDVLDAARRDNDEIHATAIDPILAIVEWTDRCIDQIAATGALDATAAAQADRLLQAIGQMAVVAPAPAAVVTAELPAWANAVLAPHTRLDPPLVAVRYVPDRECFFNGDDPLALVSQVPAIVDMSIGPREPWPAPDDLDPFRCNLVIELVTSAPLAAIEALFRLIPDQVTIVSRPAGTAPPAGPAATPKGVAGAPGVTTTVRVDTGRIDRLLDIVGELYTAKNGLAGLAEMLRRGDADRAVTRRAAATQLEFDRLLARLRQAVMGVRMVPLAQTFRRLPRVVRELAAQTGKKVDITISGDEIEADRLIVDGLFEPLLHIVRNAIDHGIEPPEGRSQLGKPGLGTIDVSASVLGDQIAIAVSDDGAGVDIERVRALAVTRGLLAADRAAELPDAAVLELLFASGFSTAASITEISGRGVGMDAVRTAIHALGGRVSITSEAGRGSTVALLLPASFSMSRLLTIEVGGERFGVPINVIAETLRIPATALVAVRQGRAFVLRERVVPFLDLAELLHLPPAPATERLVLVVQLGAGQVGVGVDAIGEQAEIMVRPLAGLLKHTTGLAGTAVLGDGRVVMVLDLEELAR